MNRYTSNLKLKKGKVIDGVETFELDKGPLSDEQLQLINPRSMICKYITRNMYATETGLELNLDERKERWNKFDGAFPFIPNNAGQIFRQFIAAAAYYKIMHGNNTPINFIDAGCGIGNVLTMVRLVYDMFLLDTDINTTGLEIDPRLVKFGNTLLGCPSYHLKSTTTPIKHQDITTFKEYSKYNMIYYYCPINNLSFQKYFEEYLEDHCAAGTIIMPNLKRSAAIDVDPRFKAIRVDFGDNDATNLFIKVKDGKRKGTRIDRDDFYYERDMRYLSVDAKNRVKKHVDKYFNKGGK